MVFFNIVTLEGVCGAHAIVVLTDPVKPNKPLCLPRVVKKNKILFDTGLRRLEGTFASFLSEKPRWPLPTVQAPAASKRELVRFRRLFRQIYVSSSHSIVKSAPVGFRWFMSSLFQSSWG